MRQIFHVVIIVGFIGLPLQTSAHKIYLHNGNVIETSWVKEEGESVNYEKYGGTISISRDLVKEIVFEKIPIREKPSLEKKSKQEINKADDLEFLLTEKLQPKTPIEVANLSTVAIQSELSFGSGFFISDDGYIITNKHVVRGDRQREKQMEDNLQSAWQQLQGYRQDLEREYARLVQYKTNLQNDWARFYEQQQRARSEREKQYINSRQGSLEDRNAYLRDWELRYQVKNQEYHAWLASYQQQKDHFEDSKEKLALQNSFEVILADETRLYASLYKTSSQHDLAILKVSGYKTPFLKPKRSSELVKGQSVFAIGSPIKMKNSVTSGVVSSLRGEFIQTNAQIYPGNSGGPLVTEEGEVVGINTMKIITEKFEGLGFAINIDTALAEFSNYLEE